MWSVHPYCSVVNGDEGNGEADSGRGIGRYSGKETRIVKLRSEEFRYSKLKFLVAVVEVGTVHRRTKIVKCK